MTRLAPGAELLGGETGGVWSTGRIGAGRITPANQRRSGGGKRVPGGVAAAEEGELFEGVEGIGDRGGWGRV